jgi:hypothetical protein
VFIHLRLVRLCQVQLRWGTYDWCLTSPFGRNWDYLSVCLSSSFFKTAISQDFDHWHLLAYVETFQAAASTSGFFKFFSDTSVATSEARRRHQALLKARHQRMQQEDETELFRNLYVFFARLVV